MLRRLFLLMLLALIAVPAARAQQADTAGTRRVEIIRADSLTGATEQGELVRRLTGDVRLRQGETRLRARRATQYEARGEILFVGDVLIVEEGDSLRADTVYYDTRQKVGRARGRMRLSDGEVVVRGPQGRYFAREKRAAFDEGVTLIDSSSVLTSRAGEYFTDEKRAEFFGHVRLNQDRAVLAADTVTYFREREVSRARGRVVIERFGDEDAEGPPSEAMRRLVAADTLAQPDTLARTLLFGDRAYSDRPAGFSRVTGNALLVRLRPDTSAAVDSSAADTASTPAAAAAPPGGTVPDTAASVARPPGAVRVDTTLLSAARIQSSRTDTLDRLIAVGGVRSWQETLSAVADSAVSDRRPAQTGGVPEREETRLFRAPMAWAWAERAQLSGDTLRITGRARSIDSLFAFPGAFVAQQDTALGRLHQLQGQRLVGYFEDDTLRTLTVGPNGEAIRFLATEDGTPDGAVEASSDMMYFTFKQGDLEKMRGSGGVQGTQYPEETLPSPLRLSGFVWRPEARPTRAALLDARVPQWLREGRVPVAPMIDAPMNDGPPGGDPPPHRLPVADPTVTRLPVSSDQAQP